MILYEVYMGRKHAVDKIHLQIDEVVPFKNEEYAGFVINWSSDLGFGQYTVYKQNGSSEWGADSECMDKGDDKEFITELMRLFVESLCICG